jgi:hypothetical protein
MATPKITHSQINAAKRRASLLQKAYADYLAKLLRLRPRGLK